MKIWIFLLVLFYAPAHAEPTPTQSLFFDADAAAKIDHMAIKKIPSTTSTSDIHLGAVIYYGPKNWTLWLQNERWDPSTDRTDMHIIDVQPNTVKLSWNGGANGAVRKITLHPYQTYRTATDKITEGTR